MFLLVIRVRSSLCFLRLSGGEGGRDSFTATNSQLSGWEVLYIEEMGGDNQYQLQLVTEKKISSS